MSADFQSIPVIDIADLSAPDLARRQAVATKLAWAAGEIGFLYITGHGLPDALFEAALAEAKAFFDQPMSAKMACYIGRSTNHSGYVPEGEEVFDPSARPDRKEAFDVNLDVAAPQPDRPMSGPNLWPPSASFRAAVSAYYAAVSALSRRLFRGFALALDLPEDHFEPHLTEPPSQLRLIHYPYDAEATDQAGIGAHTDYEFFTILRSTAPGLEVRNGQGAWIDAPPIPRAFVVNIGDMLEVWTNGRFRATAHRVRKVAQERYSMPFFATCDYATRVEPAPQFVTETSPARFTPVISGEHLYAQTVRTFRYLAGL
ncbi:MAG: 2-oxoglutarate and iron-dependent oxygenase domain-containing protein [Caulobacteraceae bacterium]|nr:2-oxoglutarate and iron-dependent oxygenase domain-containing protein [Caulobacteraceae bacterium]